MTHEVSQLFDLVQVSEFGVSHLSDNVVLLQYVRAGDELRRAITVLKTRASAHEPLRRQFRIDARDLAPGAGLQGHGLQAARGRP